MSAAPLVSVVIPVRNEAPNIPPLLAEIAIALATIEHEVICVDDGSVDDTPSILAGLAPPLRWLRHRNGCGQSAAIITGITAARGHWIATLDGDGQNDPADIPRLLALAQVHAGPVLVAGHRVQRRDRWWKRQSSRVANRIRAVLLRDATPDGGCGLKVFPRALFMGFPHFDHMHRFLPSLALRAGAAVISEAVNHRPRRHGTSHYGTLDRLSVSVLDLVGIAWLQRRASRPEIETP